MSNARATVFVADGEEACRTVLSKVQPHFAVIDPACTGGAGPKGLAWTLFSHSESRTVLYSSTVQTSSAIGPQWLITKDRPVTDILEAVLAQVNDPSWLAKKWEEGSGC